jgi:TnpA family transposase
MTTLTILTTEEKRIFVSSPVFSGIERKKYFSFPLGILTIANGLDKPQNRAYFLLMYGYFKATNKFFNRQFHQKDFAFVAGKLGIPADSLSETEYKRRTYLNHRDAILSYCGVKKFTPDTANFLNTSLMPLIHAHARPKTILSQSCEFLMKHKIETPSYNTLVILITKGLKSYQKELVRTINITLRNETKTMLDMLLVREDLANAPSYRYKLTLIKKFTQSTKPTKVRENITDLLVIKELFEKIAPAMSSLRLSPEAVKYYAHCVIKFQMLQMLRRSDEERYLYLLSFIIHQYYSAQDVLLDIIILSVQAARNKAAAQHQETTFAMRKTKAQALSTLIMNVKTQQEIVKEIRSILAISGTSSEEKINRIKQLFIQPKKQIEPIDTALNVLREEAAQITNDTDYYNILEKNSVKLQNRVSDIVKHVTFDEASSQKDIMEAIVFYKLRDGNITSPAPVGFLDEHEQKVIFDSQGKLRVSLYKALLFIHIATLIKSGGLNLKHSYKYKAFDAYLLPHDLWEKEEQATLEKTDLAAIANGQSVMQTLTARLEGQYEKTNRNIREKKNQYIRFQNGSFYLTTPKKEDEIVETITDFMPKARSIPLLSVLKTINDITKFTDVFSHFQTTHVGKKPAEKIFFAGIMGLGCNIGTAQLAQIARGINQGELENTVNWYFSVENLMSANDAIIRFIDRLSVPKLFKKDQNKTHTSSDGQKFAIGVDSLNANYSYKYFGKGKGVSVYSFIDDTHSLFYSTVISSSEREAAYVIDGLLHNEVVKSDIHSTDTHGYSEIIFAVTYLLGYSFAPRIRNFQEQRLYSFTRPKIYTDKGYAILPVATIQVDLIKEHWDEILRLIATLKLKETTASQLLKRLSSYSRQHPLYRALKAFGQIIKSTYLLQYIDDSALRQAVEKQLNKLESSNKFAKAVFYGNNQEFQQETKEEQIIAEGCKRLIENAIILWNYLYISKIIVDATEGEKENIIKCIQQSSVITWQHINLHGEYDFSEEKLKQTVAFSLPQILDLQVT